MPAFTGVRISCLLLSVTSVWPFAACSSPPSAARRPPVIQPEPLDIDGARVICYPGDARHSVREQALPGPTRLCYRNKRFEPLGGFDELFL